MSIFDHITPLDQSFAKWLEEKEAGLAGDIRDALNPYVGQRDTHEIRQEIHTVTSRLRWCAMQRFTPVTHWRRP